MLRQRGSEGHELDPTWRQGRRCRGPVAPRLACPRPSQQTEQHTIPADSRRSVTLREVVSCRRTLTTLRGCTSIRVPVTTTSVIVASPLFQGGVKGDVARRTFGLMHA